MKIQQLDHLVLTVRDIQTSIDFYTQVLGMLAISFSQNRKALKFGQQKINLHLAGNEFLPHANQPCPGSADLCFIVDSSIEDIQKELAEKNIAIESGPVERTGATHKLISVYIRDPDKNLIELSNKLSN